jgi:hypothetical protein
VRAASTVCFKSIPVLKLTIMTAALEIIIIITVSKTPDVQKPYSIREI